MINLHLHTICSDGVLEPEELLRKLELNNINVASITDHDSVDAYIRLRQLTINDIYTGLLIPGVEMKCTHNAYSIEILGYFIDIASLKPYLDNKNKKIMEFQKHSFQLGKKVCDKLKLKYDDTELKPKEFAGTAIFNLLNKYYDYNVELLGKGIIENGSDFYRKTFADPNSLFFVPEEGLVPNAKETIDKIHEVGGIAILAHLGQYKMIDDKISFLNDLYRNTDIDGIECYYSMHTEEETNNYIDFCKRNNLLISGGSDYHGTKSQNKILQENIDINNFSWINEIKKGTPFIKRR